MDVWSEDLIHIQNAEPDKHSSWIHKPLTEIMLLPIINSLEYYIKQELQIQTIPKLIIIEGVDGCGKTTLANEIIQEIGEKILRSTDEPYLTNTIHLNLQEKMLIIMDIMKLNLDKL